MFDVYRVGIATKWIKSGLSLWTIHAVHYYVPHHTFRSLFYVHPFPCAAEGLRLRAESLLRQTGGRRDRGDDTDADGDHLWGEKARARSRPGILANASKCGYRSRAASLAPRSPC